MHSYLLDLKFFREEKTGPNKTLLPNQNRNVSKESSSGRNSILPKKRPKRKKKRIEPFEKDISSHLLTYENDDPF